MAQADTVRAIYEAFGRGDVPAILERLADDVEWEYGGMPEVPWLAPRRGRAQVGGFFESLAAIEFHRFEATNLLEEGRLVVAIVQLEGTVRATGRRVFEEDEVHIWRFDGSGKVSRFRHRADTHQHWAAYTGA